MRLISGRGIRLRWCRSWVSSATRCWACRTRQRCRSRPVAFLAMTSAWAVVAAALGASLLTGGASLSVIWVQEKLRRKSSDRAALHAAVQDVLSRSIAVAMRGRAMGETMKVRSGLKEGLDVTMRHRKPVDPLELHDWIAQDGVPLNAALNEIWMRWDQEGIRLANDVVGKCLDFMDASTALQPARSGRERVRSWAMGERWTPGMIAENERAMKELAQARKRLADYARAKLGLPAVDLFAQVEASEDQEAVSGVPPTAGEPALVLQDGRSTPPGANGDR